MCHAFAGYPPAVIANELRALLTDLGWSTKALPATDDPFRFPAEVHRHAPHHLAPVEAHLAAAELIAVDSAPETPGLRELLHHLDHAGVPMAIASNNHGPAVDRWLQRTGYRRLIRHIAGRPPHDPGLMKPNPHVLLDCAHALAVEPANCCFLGDSLTDATAATIAGMPFVAMANKPHKHQQFTDHGSDASSPTSPSYCHNRRPAPDRPELHT